MKKIFVSTRDCSVAFNRIGSIAYAATGVSDPVVLKELAQVRQALRNITM